MIEAWWQAHIFEFIFSLIFLGIIGIAVGIFFLISAIRNK